jgi:hypothetical protein
MKCGSIGYGGINDIKNLYALLVSNGFSMADDLKYIESSNVVVVVANGPSYGTAFEMFVAKSLGKKIILLQNILYQHHG